jgi:hypothetical protein
MVHVKMRIVAAAPVSDPLIVLGVNVGKFRMAFLIDGDVVLGSGLPVSLRGRSAHGLRGRGTAGRDVSTANLGVTAPVLCAAVLFAAASSILRKSSRAN